MPRKEYVDVKNLIKRIERLLAIVPLILIAVFVNLIKRIER